MAERSADTIFALSSAPGRAGVAVLRISGARAGATLEMIAGTLPEPRRAALRTLRHPASGEDIDRGLVLWFPGPASFTGEDMGELQVHGGRAVVAALVGVLGDMPDLRPAEAGEFTRRAFENGRLDLTAVEGLADLINAETEAQRRQALCQSTGHLRALYESWRETLVEALALIEAALDFSDEADVPAEVEARARPLVRDLEAAIAAHLDDAHQGERLREGFCVVVAGAPNAGKSSLVNALARRDVAIVSEEAGTTRDVIEVHLDLAGYPVTVMDTAGIRRAAGAVEEEGIRRALARAEHADLTVWLIDATEPVWEPPADLVRDGGCVLPVLNKIDLTRPDGKQKVNAAVHEISVVAGTGLAAFIDDLAAKAEASLSLGEAPVITRARHRQELETCRVQLAAFLSGPMEPLELRAEDLRQAALALGRITGRVDVEDVLDHVFGEFCIGK